MVLAVQGYSLCGVVRYRALRVNVICTILRPVSWNISEPG